MAMGAPRKAKQRVWHDEARKLKADGWTYQRIAAEFGVTPTAVYFACNPEKRAEYAAKKGAKA